MLAREVFDEAMQRARSLFGARRSPTPEGVDAFFGVVSHLTDAEFGAAFAMTLRESAYYPGPSDVIRAHEKLNEAAIQRAWDLVIDTARTSGRYYTPTLPARVAGAVRACGGWQAVCLCPTEQIAAMRDRFCAAMRTGVEDTRPLDSVFGLPAPTPRLALPAPEQK